MLIYKFVVVCGDTDHGDCKAQPEQEECDGKEVGAEVHVLIYKLVVVCGHRPRVRKINWIKLIIDVY